MSTPPASADAAHNLFLASICRRWLRLAQRHVSSLLVKDNRVVSHRDVLNAVACFPHLTHLHLSDFSVETLDDAFLADLADSCPGSLSSLTAVSIETYSLQYNQLSTLLQLTNLTRLALPDEIRMIPADPPAFSLAQLPTLHSLKFGLSDAHFSVFFPPGSPYRLLKRLQLSHCFNQERLPDGIGQVLPRLQELSIMSCETLNDLTDEFTSLTCLETLTISVCSVSTLPAIFGDFPTLKALVLDQLPLRTLPASFTRLATLETFFLVLCDEMEELPAGRLGGADQSPHLSYQSVRPTAAAVVIHAAGSLTRLELEECDIVELPEGMGEMTNLQELYIQRCLSLEELPDCVAALGSLRVLRITECHDLVAVPRRLDGLTSLTQLELRDSWLLSEAPQALPLSLQALWYSGNQQVESLPDVSSLTGLRQLCLDMVDAACIEAIGEHLSGMEHLQLVLAEGDESLTALTRLPRLRTLSASGVRSVNSLVECEGSGLQELRQLNTLGNAGLKQLPAAITTLHHLTSIKINAEHLSSLPHNFGAFSRLRKLDLSGCSSLVHLPASLTQLSCLHELNVSHTSIRLLPPGFAQLSRLRMLDIYECEQLEALPDDLSELRMLEHIDTAFCGMLRR
ncbi:unnamed protein product [Closterium sp. NIES-64]|nr:unnamed protein product [Closterium sp. NIES-64]